MFVKFVYRFVDRCLQQLLLLLLLLLLNEYYLHAIKQKSCKSMLQT